MTSTSLAATSLAPTDSAALDPALPLPAWAAVATPEPERTLVGINHLGELYIYGESPEQPGPSVPALVGLVTDVAITRHGASSRYGLRDYLDITLQTPIPDVQVILRLPCKAARHPVSGELLIPWSVRSLLAALQTISLSSTAVKLQTRRGSVATFFRVLPFSSEGIELPEIRCEAIGGSRDDLQIALNHIRIQLGLPPLFPGVTTASSEQPAAESTAA